MFRQARQRGYDPGVDVGNGFGLEKEGLEQISKQALKQSRQNSDPQV
jgi:hypothetical protein